MSPLDFTAPKVEVEVEMNPIPNSYPKTNPNLKRFPNPNPNPLCRVGRCELLITPPLLAVFETVLFELELELDYDDDDDGRRKPAF